MVQFSWGDVALGQQAPEGLREGESGARSAWAWVCVDREPREPPQKQERKRTRIQEILRMAGQNRFAPVAGVCQLGLYASQLV